MDRLASAALCDGWEVRVLHALQVSTVSLILLESVLTMSSLLVYTIMTGLYGMLGLWRSQLWGKERERWGSESFMSVYRIILLVGDAKRIVE